MYPPKPTGQYYPTAPPVGTAPPPSMGIPVGATNPNNYQQYPAAFQTQSRGPVPWSTGLLDCTDDCGNCCMTCFCPCITFGRIAEIVDQGSTSCGASGALYGLLEYFTCCHWLYSCMYRSKLRAQYSLAESPCNDCLVHCCCEVCALCQEYRELKSRGFDMIIGWQGNMERQARGTTFQPPMQGGMTR